MHRFLSACVTGAVAVLLQACERPDADTGATALRSPQARVNTRLPAAEAEAPPTRIVARPLPAASGLSDAMITARVKALLVTDPALGGADLSVNTDRGVVNLAGTVRSHEQLAIASGHAQGEDGVMRIESHVAVLNP